MTETIFLAESGASPFVIAVPDTTAEQRFAASELQRYIEKISGACLPIASKPPTAAHILLQCINQSGFDIDIAPERIRITGSDPSTLLHATYTFLEMLGGERVRPVERASSRPSTIAKGVGLAVLEEPQAPG